MPGIGLVSNEKGFGIVCKRTVFRKSICVFNIVSRNPDEGNIIKNIVLSLFQNGRQRAEIAIP